VVQVDGAGSDSLVDPGVACWVGISGALGAREDKGLVGMAVRGDEPFSSSLINRTFRALSIRF